MARPLRIEYAGACSYVTTAGNAGATIAEDDLDYVALYGVLANVIARLGWHVFAYCMLPRRYHLVVETPAPTLSQGMRELNGVYTQRYNTRYGRHGHLFQGRYKSIVLDREAYLLPVARRLAFEPVREGLVKRPEQWRWSSYRALIGRANGPPWLSHEPILSHFSRQPGEARRAFQAYVEEKPDEDVWSQVKHQVFLGDDHFVQSVRRHAGHASAAMPRSLRVADRRPLERYAASAPTRDEAIRAAWASGDYTLAEIGGHFGLHYSTVSRIANTVPAPESSDASG